MNRAYREVDRMRWVLGWRPPMIPPEAAFPVEEPKPVARPQEGEWRSDDARGWLSYVVGGKVWAHTEPRDGQVLAFDRTGEMRLIGAYPTVEDAIVAVVEYFSWVG